MAGSFDITSLLCRSSAQSKPASGNSGSHGKPHNGSGDEPVNLPDNSTSDSTINGGDAKGGDFWLNSTELHIGGADAGGGAITEDQLDYIQAKWHVAVEVEGGKAKGAQFKLNGLARHKRAQGKH